MKKILFIISVFMLTTLLIQSDVIKKSRSEVSFLKYGTYKTERNEVISLQIKRTDSEDTFKGKGFLSKLAAKVFFKSGKFSKIIDLKGSKVSQINHKKKRVTVRAIKKIGITDDSSDGNSEDDPDENEGSDVKITKNEFKVMITGNKKMINKFPAVEYSVSWIIEWESEEDSSKGSSRLNSIVWTTPVTNTIKLAEKVEVEFFKNYMGKLGLDQEKFRQDILGTSWLRIFSSLSKSSSKQSSEDAEKFKREISKIKGYPVIIDGEYFHSSDSPEKKKKGVKSAFGKVFKKKKKVDAEEKPKFTFYTEVLALSIDKSDPAKFENPEGYKVKEK